MADPIVSKVATKPLDISSQQAKTGPKTSESKFDQVRTRLMDEQAKQTQLPPEVKQISPAQKQQLQTDLSKRIQESGTSPDKLFGVKMKHATAKLEHLTKRVNSLPKTSAFDPIRKRVESISAQYQSTGELAKSPQGGRSLDQLMQIQMQMYQMTENMELMSKVVEQVTSGMKSILQTQV
jgi:phage shock protein A